MWFVFKYLNSTDLYFFIRNNRYNYSVGLSQCGTHSAFNIIYNIYKPYSHTWGARLKSNIASYSLTWRRELNKTSNVRLYGKRNAAVFNVYICIVKLDQFLFNILLEFNDVSICIQMILTCIQCRRFVLLISY